MTKTAGSFHAIVASGPKLIGASVVLKQGSIRKILALPTNNSTGALTALMALIVAVDKLTDSSVRAATTNIFQNSTADDIPADFPGTKPNKLFGTAYKTAGGLIVPGFKNDWSTVIREASTDAVELDTSLKSANALRNLIEAAIGSFYGSATTMVKKLKVTADVTTTDMDIDPEFIPSAVFDSAINNLNPFPPFYIRSRLGDRTQFNNFPSLHWGTGAGDIDDLAYSDTYAEYTPANNMSAVLNIAKVLQDSTAAQIQGIGISVISNSNAVIPNDIVGREAALPITFRVTDAANRTQQQTFKITIPNYSNWSGLDADARQALIVTDIGGYFKSVYSNNNTDEVEVLF